MLTVNKVGIVLCGFMSVALAAGHTLTAAEQKENQPDTKAGQELFTREWLPNDKRSFAGDGLGPVHNARSCVACHNQAGIGGAGGGGSNSILVSAFVNADGNSILRTLRGIPPEDIPNPLAPYPQPDRSKLAKLHPSLRTERSFVFHRNGNDPAFGEWHCKLLHRIQTQGLGVKPLDGIDVGLSAISLITSVRNPPPLFGLSLIETISDAQIGAVAAEQAKSAKPLPADFKLGGRRTQSVALPIAGRVLRLQNGSIGRFGWKNSVATIREFTLLACATELGLEVPGMHRSPPPWIENYQAPGLDLNENQLNRLSDYVKSLPRPQIRKPNTDRQASNIETGKKLFGELGCANCHRANLGNVGGLYSDLLLHDMGLSLSGAGTYQTTLEVAPDKATANPLAVIGNFALSKSNEVLPRFAAGAREWRTPPLWGLRDSGPYLHDGRADTIEQAIKLHDGEGLRAAQAFAKLSPVEAAQVCAFLESLIAPTQIANSAK